MTLRWRTTGIWGTTLGRRLTKAEVDENFYTLQEAIAAKPDAVSVVGIESIDVVGDQLTITLTDSSTSGPFTLPVASLQWRDEWADDADYLVNDLVLVSSSPDDITLGVYRVLQDHTAEAPFDPDLEITGQPVYQLTLPIIRGEKGDSFNPNDVGTFAERDAHDGELRNYSYLSTDGDGDLITTAVIFIKASDAAGDWGPALLFQGPPGEQGEPGDDGATGATGATGAGVPAGGSNGQAVVKSGSSTVWQFPNFSFYAAGIFEDDEVLWYQKMPAPWSLPASLTGSYGVLQVAATASTVFTLKKNGSSIGTATFGIGGTTATFSFASTVAFAAGDVFSIHAPATADATAEGLSLSLKAS